METRRLKAFIKMVEAGTLTRAAEQLGIAQPSLSQQVSALEAEFGAKLLNRSKRGVTPTPAGELLYRHAQTVLKQIEQAHQEIRQAGSNVAGVAAVGMIGSVASVLVLPLLIAVRERYPAVLLRITEGASSLLAELAMNGRLDFAMVAGDVMLKGLMTTPLMVEQLVLVSAPGAAPPGANRDVVTLSSLADHPLVLPSRGNGPRTLVDRTFSRAGLEPNVVAELDSIANLFSATAAGVGSTIVTWAAARRMGDDVQIRKIIDPDIERTVGMAAPDFLPMSTPARAVQRLILEEARRMIDDGNWPGARLIVDQPADPWA